MHAKNFCADDNIGVVGTSNLDYGSLYLLFDCAAVLYGCSTVKQIRRDFETTLKRCTEITQHDIASRPIGKRIVSWVLRLIAPLI